MLDRIKLSSGEDAEFVSMSISQLCVGKMEVSTYAAIHSDGSPVYHRAIEIIAEDGTPNSWGETIFKGTLKELIEHLTEWHGVTA